MVGTPPRPRRKCRYTRRQWAEAARQGIPVEQLFVWQRKVYRERKDPFEEFDDMDFIAWFRLPKWCVSEMAEEFVNSPFCSTQGDKRGGGLSFRKKRCLGLRYLATGANYQVLRDSQGVTGKATISHCINEVIAYLNGIYDGHVQFPHGEDVHIAAAKIRDRFGIYGCVGVVNGTYVPIMKPIANEAAFLTRHHYYGMNVLTFPEPLFFNKETGGFEIVTDAKEQLATKIKAAVRAGRPKKKIYRAVRRHAFMPVPLIPMEDPPPEETREIDTSFVVQTLNKEQGIEWIKKARLTSFLESECYLEYRLAHLVAQAQVTADPGGPVSLRIDHTPRIPPARKSMQEAPPGPDEDEKIMKDLFVCMGSASTTDTEAWVSQAKMAHTMVGTSALSQHPRPVSALVPFVTPPSNMRSLGVVPTTHLSTSGATHIARPTSSLTDSTWRDSGIGSPTKLSLYGSTLDVTGYANSVVSQDDIRETESEVGDEDAAGMSPGGVQSRLFRPDSKPLTPRASDAVCVSAEGSARPGSTVYAAPLHEEDEDSCSVASSQRSAISSAQSDTPSINPGSGDIRRVFDDLDTLGSIIVGTVLKYAVAETTGVDPKQVLDSHKVIKDLFHSDSLSRMTMDDLNQLDFSTMKTRLATPPNAAVTATPTAREPQPLASPPKGEIKKQELTRTTHSSESDEDSMLDSDGDYDDDRDKIFKKRQKKFKLTNKKGIDKFKRFLGNTRGEKNWYFWLDVDRGRLLMRKENVPSYLSAMRERYQLPGAPYELSRETKVDLGLVEPSQWTMEKLLYVQNKQSSAARPERNYMYNLQRQAEPPGDSHPNPVTIGLLPLRPKTCMPRLRQMEPPTMTITAMFNDVTPRDEKQVPQTSPRVGMKRTHSLPDMYKNRKKDKEKENQQRQRSGKKTPKQLVCARTTSGGRPELPRPPATPRVTRSAPDRRARSCRSSDQWDTFSNLSLPSSVHTDPRGGRPRPCSALSLSSDDQGSEVSQFLGGRRMEGLLQALASEKKAGGVIRKYLDTTGNQLWLNCLAYWHELQEYHRMFYADVLDAYLLQKKAKYIVMGAPHNIHCNSEIRTAVHAHIKPPFEDLFDAAEEFILDMLYDAWSQMVVSDLSTFDKVELIEVKRHIDTRSRYMVTLQRRGIIKARSASTMGDIIISYPGQVALSSLASSSSGCVPFNYSNVEVWLSVPRTRDAIMRDYLTVPGTQQVLGARTFTEREQLIADVTNLEGPMQHLSEQDQQYILHHVTQELDEVKIAEFFEQLELGEGTFNTLTITERDKIIKQVHVHQMLQKEVPTEKDLDTVAEMYGGLGEENEGFMNEQRLNMLQDFQEGKGPADDMAVNLREELVRHLQIGDIEEVCQAERDDLIHRIVQADGEFTALSEEHRHKVVSMLVIAAGAETQAVSSPGSLLEVLKNLRTGICGMETLGESVCAVLQRHTNMDEKAATVSHRERMELMKMVHTGEGTFSTLSEEQRENIMGTLKLAARSKFMVDLSVKAQDNVLDRIEMGSDINVMDVKRIKEHLDSSKVSKKRALVTMRDREDLIEKMESGEAGTAFTDSEKEMLLKQLKITKQTETRKIMEKHRQNPKGEKPGGFGEFAEGGGTLEEVMNAIEDAGLELGDLVRLETPEDPMVGYQEPVYDESLIESIPEEFRDYTLEKLVHNRIELEHFRQFLAENYASMDLLCWMDVEAFRRTPHNQEKKRDQKAKDMKTKYMNKKYFFGPNSPAGKEGQEKMELMDNVGNIKEGDTQTDGKSNDLKLPSIENALLSGQVNGVTPATNSLGSPSMEKLPPLDSRGESQKKSARKRSVCFNIAGDTDEEVPEREVKKEKKKKSTSAVVEPDAEPTVEETDELIFNFIDEVVAVGGGWGKLLDDRPPSASLLEAQKYVRTRLEKKWLPLFITTPEFADRQRPKSSLDDVVEDVMIQKKKKSQAVWRMLESRWVSSSTDIITFRKALLNPITSLQFRRFVSIKGDNYENDVLFWQEIQRYKDLCHMHSDRALIQQKTVAIVNCFIDSTIPPALQVDLTQEMADRVVERKLEATPYIFRESQLTVFRVLFPYWSDFCQFRQNLAADKILPTIERHRRRAKAEEKRRQEEAKERKEKLKLQRKEARKLEKQLDKERLERLEGRDDRSSSSSSPVVGLTEDAQNVPKRETARRRALGLAVDPDEDEGYRKEQHEVPSSGEEDELDLGSEAGGDDTVKDHQMAWSYSGYMNALEEEKVLNEVDESTFSCVSETSSRGVPGKEHIELTDDPPSRRASVDASRAQADKTQYRPESAGSKSGQRTKPSHPRNSRADHVVSKPPPAPASDESARLKRRLGVARSK